ncbi:Putative Allergen Asp f 4 [Aspergillus calidoustus]|uniref:Putative Allergen Asp f 4 n=1 Tax=Aspergillus calidoustus TaxID=454130 RepID=A0A0U5G456_ASPCI|nr:Putative Allergen Asp f 4 [Aspergillus calidoustus]
MKCKSLLLTGLAAGSATARAHGLHQAAHHHQRKDVNPVVETVWTTKTVVNWEVATVYTTVTAEPTTTTITITTAAASDPSTSTSTASASATTTDAVVLGTDTISVKQDYVVDSSSTTTSESTSSSTVTASETTATTTTTTAAATSSSSTSTSDSSDWSSTPSDGVYSTTGFGERTNSSGSGVSYTGNVGSPWGSNIIEVDSSSASSYKYVIQLTGSSSADWFVSFWNKIGPDGQMDGWYGHSALNFTLAAGETRYVAFDEDSQGGWGAAEGSSLPTDQYGGYACTWGEFDFGSTINDGWSGWDVSAIQAQNADLTVQGMKICTAAGEDCSYITTDAASVVNAYTAAEAAVDGIGGSVTEGAVRLAVEIDYSG